MKTVILSTSIKFLNPIPPLWVSDEWFLRELCFKPHKFVGLVKSGKIKSYYNSNTFRIQTPRTLKISSFFLSSDRLRLYQTFGYTHTITTLSEAKSRRGNKYHPKPRAGEVTSTTRSQKISITHTLLKLIYNHEKRDKMQKSDNQASARNAQPCTRRWTYLARPHQPLTPVERSNKKDWKHTNITNTYNWTKRG